MWFNTFGTSWTSAKSLLLTSHLTSNVSTVLYLTCVIYDFGPIKVKEDRNGTELELAALRLPVYIGGLADFQFFNINNYDLEHTA